MNAFFPLLRLFPKRFSFQLKSIFELRHAGKISENLFLVNTFLSLPVLPTRISTGTIYNPRFVVQTIFINADTCIIVS